MYVGGRNSGWGELLSPLNCQALHNCLIYAIENHFSLDRYPHNV